MPHLCRRTLLFVIAVQLVFACAPSLCSRARAESLGEWITSERDATTRKLIAAVGRNGAVIASPDESTPNQNYYFHWTRDGALTMNVIAGFYQNAPTNERRDEYGRILLEYVRFSRKNQKDPKAAALSGIGEPKFRVDGTAFSDPWGRPQNDGPALRAITLCRWANALLDQHQQAAIIEQEILPVVIDDLKYVEKHWRDRCVDLWEEVRGKNFYTEMVQRRSMVDGAKLFERVRKSQLASECRAEIPELQKAIGKHFDAS